MTVLDRIQIQRADEQLEGEDFRADFRRGRLRADSWEIRVPESDKYQRKPQTKLCACGAPLLARGFCRKHYLADRRLRMSGGDRD